MSSCSAGNRFSGKNIRGINIFFLRGNFRLIYPSLDELLKRVDSRYTLVTATAKRARRILDESRSDEEKTIKAVSLALYEIGSNKVKIEHTKSGIK
jgi:DNA-directed RNA polymerase subunit omega